MRRIVAITCALPVIAAVLSACGSSASSTAESQAAAPSPSSVPGKEVERAGRARSFLEPEGDNSIPTFGVEAAAHTRAQAADALQAYLEARAGGVWSRACAGLSAPLRSQVEALGGGRTCPVAYAALADYQPVSARADSLSGELVSLRVKGRSGFALWVGPHGHKYVMPMAREHGRWRAGQIAPVPYPLGSSVPSP